MMRRKLAALLAAILFGTAALPTTIAYAQGNDPDAASVTEVTETTEKEDPALLRGGSLIVKLSLKGNGLLAEL